jgi:hypothetical protein
MRIFLVLTFGAAIGLAAGCTQTPSPPVAPPPAAARVQPPDWFHQQVVAARAARRAYQPSTDTLGAQRAYDNVMTAACTRAASADLVNTLSDATRSCTRRSISRPPIPAWAGATTRPYRPNAMIDCTTSAHVDLRLFVLRRDHAGACGHEQHLIAVMGVPARGAALAEVDHAAIIVCRFTGLDEWSDGSAQPGRSIPRCAPRRLPPERLVCPLA